MNSTALTPFHLNKLWQGEIENLILEDKGLILVYEDDTETIDIYSSSQAEDSDPDPIFQSATYSMIFNFIKNY